ncbi:hypothetical protein ALC62_07846 [Cyphomyrmex costatus]|uniref:Uncharacterized protein n=1 Tax=Cyphomyrmex costatus TaxID=456900 RepID=A0A195CL89_9HYME|nr:hypothetical protein ALC62_07846 [Cyphomyrmex costatus]
MCETAVRQLGRANSPAKRRMIYSENIARVFFLVVPITALPHDEGHFLPPLHCPASHLASISKTFDSVDPLLKDYAIINVLTRALRRPAYWEMCYITVFQLAVNN